MSVRKPAAKVPPSVNFPDPDDCEGRLSYLGGSQSDHWNNALANQVVRALWLKNLDAEEQNRQLNAAVAALAGIGPRDELEGMMAAHLVAAHSAAMECYRRAMLGEQTLEGRRENLNQANKLSRTWATMLETLNRHRGKGQQKVTVEHVHVHAGGQAVVGMVERAGGGGQTKREQQPHAKREIASEIGHVSESTLRRDNTRREAVPSACDDERPLPDARREITRRADR